MRETAPSVVLAEIERAELKRRRPSGHLLNQSVRHRSNEVQRLELEFRSSQVGGVGFVTSVPVASRNCQNRSNE